MKRILQLCLFIVVLFSISSCGQNDIKVDDFSFVLGKWESKGSERRFAKCECSLGQEDDMICEVVTYQRADTSVYSRVKLHIYKDIFKWKISEEVFGIRQQDVAFELDKSKTRIFELATSTPQRIYATRTSEEGRDESLNIEISKQGKLIITDQLYVFNFEKLGQ